MNVGDWLKLAENTLKKAGVQTGRLDSLVLLEDQLCVGRAQILAYPDKQIDKAKLAKLEKLLKMRADHQPLAYLRGKTEFYGREFIITSAVLEPRPESETIIDILKSLCKDGTCKGGVRIGDVGSGSGALGITAALEVENAVVELLEIDDEALKVSKINVDKFTLGISVIKSDLLASGSHNYDILLCNLPYVPDGYEINRAAMNEPKIAIFGGPDGLDLYRRLFEQIARLNKLPLYLILESFPTQHDALKVLAESVGYKLAKTDDFIQLYSYSPLPTSS